MNTCESCTKNHESNYGSGRFCSEKCARRFSSADSKGKKRKVYPGDRRLESKPKILLDDEVLRQAVTESFSWTELSKKFGLEKSGTRVAILKRELNRIGLDIKEATSHFTAYQYQPDNVLVKDSQYTRKVAKLQLLKMGRELKCEWCGICDMWNGRALTLALDHINGDNRDHRPENLRFLCPNCHSQTDTYCGRNKK